MEKVAQLEGEVALDNLEKRLETNRAVSHTVTT